MTDLENKQAYFTNLNADNTEVFYTNNYNYWYLQNSKQANFNNKTLTGLKKDVRGITNFLGFRNDNIEVATVDFDGYKIKEDEFIEYEMGKVNELLNSPITSQLKRKLRHYLDFLNTKKEASQPHHDSAPEDLQSLKNNFDSNAIEVVYDYFKVNLVDKNRLSKDDLIKYLKQAFDEQKPPKKKFELKYDTKGKITKVFYDYYKKEKPYGQQQKYVDLLRLYFLGFENITTSNFNK